MLSNIIEWLNHQLLTAIIRLEEVIHEWSIDILISWFAWNITVWIWMELLMYQTSKQNLLPEAYYASMCEDIIFVKEIPSIKPVHLSWHFWSIYSLRI